MDSNPIRCPTCNHSVSNIAEACAYCGALMLKEKPPPLTGGIAVVENAQAAVSPPPLPHEETPSDDVMAEEGDETPSAATEKSDSSLFHQTADLPAVAETSVSATESVSVEDELESKPPDDEQELESELEIEQFFSDIEGDFEDEILLPLDPEVADLTADEPDKLESLGHTILLEAIDEIQPSAGNLPDKVEESVKLDFAAEAVKIEKAAQEMAAALEKQKASLAEAQKIKKQKAALAKAQALKKQNVALEKARALKKEKMILAKTAALKRKKASQAQALKTPNASQAGIETTKNDDIAAAKAVPAAGQPDFIRRLATTTKMQSLIEKYKGQVIGINYDNSAEIREAQLVEANGEFFSVFVKDSNLQYSYPLKTILTVIEGKDGVDMGDCGKKSKFNAVIKVYPLVLL